MHGTEMVTGNKTTGSITTAWGSTAMGGTMTAMGSKATGGMMAAMSGTTTRQNKGDRQHDDAAR